MRQKLIFGLKILVILGIITLTGLVYFHQGDFTSLDLGRHLKNGQIVWSELQVLHKNWYSYTETNFPFINHHWLGGVIFWLLYLVGGFKILTALNILLGLAAVLITFKLAVKKSNFLLATFLAWPVILLLSERMDIRPEMFSYVFIALTFYLLEDFRQSHNVKKLIWLMPLFLVWVNLHIYFFIGLFLVGLTLMEQLLLQRKNFFKADYASKFFYLALASVIACLFNPNFIRGLLFPFQIMKKYGYDIVENKSPFYLEHLTVNYNIVIFKIVLSLLIISFVWLLVKKRRIDFYYLALAIFFTFLAGLYIRNLPIFGLMIWPIMAFNFQQGSVSLAVNSKSRTFLRGIKPRGEDFSGHSSPRQSCGTFGKVRDKLRQQEIGLLAGLALIYGLVLAILIHDNLGANNFFNKNLGLGMNQGSLESIKFYQANHLPGPIFNNYDIGSALIFWLYPNERVFVDNRPEAYSVDFFNRIYRPMQNDKARWQEVSQQYDIKSIYFSHTDGTPWTRQFLTKRLHDDNWPLIYFDCYTVLMVENNTTNQPLIAEYKTDEQKFVVRFKQLLAGAKGNERNYLANLASLYGRNDLAEDVYQAILAVWPADGKILASLGFLYSSSTDSAGALKSIEYLDKALANGYVLPAVYNQLGLDYWLLSDYQQAEKMWQKTLKLDAGNESAKSYLKQAQELIK